MLNREFPKLRVILYFFALMGCTEELNSLTGKANSGLQSINFVDPGSSLQTANESIEIKIKLKGISTASSYIVYYLSNATTSKRGQIVSGSLSGNSEIPITWNTAELPSGEYHLYADLTHDNIKLTTTAPYKVRISHSSGGNLPPAVTLTAPNGGENIETGYVTTITWTGSDPEGAPVVYALEYSADSGTNWVAITSGISGSTYDWSVPSGLTEGNTYVIRITATDSAGDSSFDLSDGAFLISRPITWTNTVFTMLQPSCGGASCHATGGAWANTFDTDVYSNSEGTGGYAKRERIWARVNNSTMPPNGSGYPYISEANRNLLWIWLNTGARE